MGHGTFSWAHFQIPYMTRSKNMGPKGVLIEKENVVIIMWTLVMQECKCSKNLYTTIV